MVKAVINDFSSSRIPELHIGTGTIQKLIILCRKYNIKKPFFITGESSLDTNGIWSDISGLFNNPARDKVSSEPEPELVDAITAEVKKIKADGIISIGGGSVMDTGKAVAAMAMESDSVINFLEGVGTSQPTGKRISHIAVPTTSGTGSEATKNAVLSKIGADGFKKSLRHDNYIPDAVVIDSNFLVQAPLLVSQASAMDAVTQLLESYLSLNATALTDTLALQGLDYAFQAFETLSKNLQDHQTRLQLAYAAYLSGITLANAGLGVVHGFASVLGSAVNIPHGIVCAILLPESTEKIAELLLSDTVANEYSINKLAYAGKLIKGESSNHTAINDLVKHLHSMKKQAGFASLQSFGIKKEYLNDFAETASNKNTPIALTVKHRLQILQSCY